MTDYVAHGGIRIAKELHDLVRDEIAPGTGIEAAKVWSLLDAIVRELGPRNRALLDKRDALQTRIDGWLGDRRGKPIDPRESRAFLTEIGYLVPVGPAFKVTTANVDPEIGTLAGPQLVVPVDNPRYALNAANARWGSLYDALYGTNVIADDGGAEKGKGYNPVRGGARDRVREPLPRRRGATRDRVVGRPHEPRARGRPARRHARGRSHDGAPRRGAVRGLPEGSRTPVECAVAPQRAAHRHPDRRERSDRQASSGGRQRRRARKRGVHDHGLRGLRRGRRRGRQDRRLPQLGRDHARHADRVVPQGRLDGESAPEPGPRVHGARRQSRSRCPAAACYSSGTSARTCSRTP